MKSNQEIYDGLLRSANYHESCAADMKKDAELVLDTFVAENDGDEAGYRLVRGRRYYRRPDGMLLVQPGDSRMWMPGQWPEADRVKYTTP